MIRFGVALTIVALVVTNTWARDVGDTTIVGQFTATQGVNVPAGKAYKVDGVDVAVKCSSGQIQVMGVSGVGCTSDFATSTQGAKADTAVQPAALGTASTLNTGIGIGDVPILTDDGNSLPTLSIPSIGTTAADGDRLVQPYNSTAPQPCTPELIGSIYTSGASIYLCNGVDTWVNQSSLVNNVSLFTIIDWPAQVLSEEVATLDGISTSSTIQAQLDALSSRISYLETVVSNGGSTDITPPVLTRVTPGSASPGISSNSLTINYTATDTGGMDGTHPLTYQIGSGSVTDFTTGSDTALTGFAEGPNTVTVKAKNSAGLESTDTLAVSYSPSGSFSDSCTAGLELAAHFESTNIATEGGCSNLGDTTWAANGSVSISSLDKSDGLSSVLGDAASRYYYLNVTQNFPSAEGTLWFDFRLDTYTSIGTFISAAYDASNSLSCFMVNGSGGTNIDIRCAYKVSGTNYTVTADTNITQNTGEWYRVKWEWKTSAATDNRINVWALDSSYPRAVTGSPITASTNSIPGTLANPPTKFSVGVVNGSAYKVNVDNVKLYSTSGL